MPPPVCGAPGPLGAANMRVYSLGPGAGWPAPEPPGAPYLGAENAWVAPTCGVLPAEEGKFGVGGAEAAGGNIGLLGGGAPEPPGSGTPNPLDGGAPPTDPGTPNMLVNCPGASTAFGNGNLDPAFGNPPPIPPLSGNEDGMLGSAGGGAPGEAENMRVNSPGPCEAAPGPLAGARSGGSGGIAAGA